MVAVRSISPPRGFTKLHNAILLDHRLSSEARLLLGVLEHHARGKGVCYVGYPRICLLLGVTEKTARRRVRELEAAGLVRVERLGWGRVNRYHLLAPEREILPSPERECVPIIEKDSQEEEKRAMPVDISTAPPAKPFAGLEKSTRSRPQRLYDSDRSTIRAVMEVVARETNDAAPLAATTTRAVRAYRRSGVTLDAFVDACDAARDITKERGTVIRAVDTTTGRKRKAGYFFACLEDRLGLRNVEGDGWATGAPRLGHGTQRAAALGPVPPQEEGYGVEQPPISKGGAYEVTADVTNTTRARLKPNESHMRIHSPAHDWPSELINLGIVDRIAFIRNFGRGPFADPAASVAFARRRLG